MPEGKPTDKALFDAVKNGNLAEVERLLDHGADLEARDNHGWTPLHWACYWGRAVIVRTLLERGAVTEVKDRDGYTPLQYASRYGRPDIARMLLDAGADIEARDRSGNTPLDIACKLSESNPAREPLLEIFRDRFPEAYFTKFCESQSRVPG